MIGQTLYGVTKGGNIKTWECHVTDLDDRAGLAIITRTKIDGKAIYRNEVIDKGKNLGKSNETTPYEQAMSEAKSRYNKKIDQGYKLEIPTDTTKANNNAMDLPKPMLAHPIDKVKKIEFPAHFQQKLDGHRAITTRQDGKMLMYSRQGKPITTMQHILDYLEAKVEEGMFLDGELYIHDEALQNIGSLIKKARPESVNITYYVYDIISDEPYVQRYDKLRILLDDEEAPVHLLPTLVVKSMEEAQELTAAAIEEGFEGGILRTPDTGYLAGFRSRTLLKIKKFDDSEHIIVDVVEGKDRLVNDVALKVACFMCETPEGKSFEVTAHGDMYEKDRTWHNRKDFIGKFLTVKHSGYTKDKIPWHPVALRLREDI